MKYRDIILLIPMLLCIGCHPQSSHDANYEKAHDSDYDIEHYRELSQKKFNDELNLQPLQNCVDSFELRLRTAVSLLEFRYGQVLVIKKSMGAWKCLEYNYIFRTAPRGSTDLEYLDQFAIDTIWIYKKQPPSGWKEFFKKINDEHIYDLPGRDELRKTIDSLKLSILDGITYEVEFVNNKRYRDYTFNSPQILADEIPACRRMANIIKIFDKEFGVADDPFKIIRRLPEEVIPHYDTTLQHTIRAEKRIQEIQGVSNNTTY